MGILIFQHSHSSELLMEGLLHLLHRCKRGSTGSSLGLGKSLLINISTFLSSRHIVLCLSVLSQVQSSNLLSLLNLLLVRLDLSLQLVNQGLHALMVLPILVLLVGKLLDLALRLSQVLLRVSTAPVFSIQLRFQFPDAGIHSCHGFLASLECIGLGIINTSLHVLDLSLQKLLLSLKALSQILLCTKFICKA